MLQIFFDLLISTRMICGFALYFWHVSFLCTVCLPLLTFFHTSTFITLSFTHIFLYHQPLLSPLLTPMILLFRLLMSVFLCLPHLPFKAPFLPLCLPSCASLPGDKLSLLCRFAFHLHLCMATTHSVAHPSCCTSSWPQTLLTVGSV